MGPHHNPLSGDLGVPADTRRETSELGWESGYRAAPGAVSGAHARRRRRREGRLLVEGNIADGFPDDPDYTRARDEGRASSARSSSAPSCGLTSVRPSCRRGERMPSTLTARPVPHASRRAAVRGRGSGGARTARIDERRATDEPHSSPLRLRMHGTTSVGARLNADDRDWLIDDPPSLFGFWRSCYGCVNRPSHRAEEGSEKPSTRLCTIA